MAESVILDKFSGLAPKKKFKGIEIGKVMLDFTPDSHITEIKTRAARKRWILINIVVFAGCMFATLGVLSTTLLTSAEVEATRVEKTQIQSQLGKFSQQENAVTQNSAVTSKLTQAGGGEIDWYALVSNVQGALPSGTSVSSMSINIDDGSAERSSTVLMNLSSDGPLGYPDTLAAMENTSGVSNVQISQLGGGAGGYTYSMVFDYDTSIRTYRFGAPPTQVASDSSNTTEETGE